MSKFIKYTLIIALLALIAAGGFLAIFPRLISSEEGRRFLVEQMNSRINGKLEVDKLLVSWTGTQTIEGIRLKAADGKEIITIQELSTEASVFSFFKDCPDFGETKIVALKASIVKESDGKLNIEKVFSKFQSFDENAQALPASQSEPSLKAHVMDIKCPIPFSGSLRIIKSRLSWKDQIHEMVEVRSLEGNLEVSAKKGRIDGNLNGVLQCTSDEGKIAANVGFETTGEKIDFNAALDPMPLSFLVNLFALKDDVKEQLDAIFGKSVNGKVKLNLKEREGDLDLLIKSDNTQATMLSHIKNKELILREPLTVSVPVNQKLSAVTLKKVNPLLVQAVSGEKPISLYVDTQGFKIPLSPFDIKTVEMPKATIEFGKIQAKNGGILSLLLALFQTNIKQNSLMTLWFTPQYLSMSGGVLNSKRMDILIADSIHICSWGNVDFDKDKIDMVLGITGDTLSHAFHINSVNEDYVLQTPIRGSIDNPKVDFGKTVALIASLRLAGSDKKLLGNLLSGVFTEKKSGDAPSPTTTPFPWGDSWKAHAAQGNVKEESEQKNDKGDSKQDQPSDKDVLKKALQKEALKLFKK